MRKWLHYVISLDDSEERTFEFTEYSDIQFRLQPDGCDVELTVTRPHHDESLGVYVLDLKQLAGDLVESTARYREWLLEQNPNLASAKDSWELQELSAAVSEEVITPDDEANE